MAIFSISSMRSKHTHAEPEIVTNFASVEQQVAVKKPISSRRFVRSISSSVADSGSEISKDKSWEGVTQRGVRKSLVVIDSSFVLF
jgi:hypothetical protein